MEKYYIAVISAAKGLGSVRVRNLIHHFGTAQAVWTAEQGDIEQSGLPHSALESFLEFRKRNPHAVEKLIAYCAEEKIKLCSIVDDDYPPLLKEIKSPPAVFYYYGKLEPFAERIAMVGTRRCTPYGKNVAEKISEDLARAGITVVSGAAIGIDTFSHKGAMKFGRTIAVLGCGINFRESLDKQKFLNEIVENGGLVLSEFEPTLQPQAGTFPTRNRIIAGLSRGVIVVEAGEKSGALLTADFAADFNREVFAIPGNIFSPQSKGCHNLLREGGHLITSAQDILDFYKFSSEANIFDYEEKISEQNISAEKISDKKNSAKKILNSPPVVLDEIEKKVLNLIPFDENITVDEILLQEDELEPNEISEILLKLEIKKVIQENDSTYVRI